MNEFRWMSAATLAVGMLAATSCAATVDPGPLSIGSGAPQPNVVSCAAELGASGSFFGGDRLRNDTEEMFVITSAVVNGAEGLTIEPLGGRYMTHADPHFLIVSASESSTAPFASAVATTGPLEGMQIAPGEEIGIVIAASLDEDFGHLDSVTITYQADGRTYRNTSTASFQGAAGACPE